MNLCTNKYARLLLGFIFLYTGITLVHPTATTWAADLASHQWMIQTEDSTSVEELLEVLPNDAMLQELAVH